MFYLAKQEEGPEHFPGFYYGFYCIEDVKWPKQKALLSYVVVSSPQCGEK